MGKYKVGDFVTSSRGGSGPDMIDQVGNLSDKTYFLRYRQASLDEGSIGYSMTGGYGGWYREEQLSPVTDPVSLLRCRYTKLLLENAEIGKKLEVNNAEMSSIRIALDVIKGGAE